MDTDAAEATPGVAAVITAADLPALPPRNRPTLLLARERAIFVGHPVALVLAENEAAAADAAEAVLVDYEPLDAVVTIEQAEATDAPAVWPDGLPGQSEEAAAHGAGDVSEEADAAPSSPNVTNAMRFERGDLAAGFAEADAVVERVFRTASVHQSYIEPHASLVDPDPMGDGMTVYCSTQAPFFVRDAVAHMVGMPQDRVKVVGTPVGGGFGAKFVLYEPLLALAAVRHQRPVRLVMTRTEEMLAATPAPSTRITIRAGAKRSGEITALEAELAIDCGCFPSSMTALAGTLLGSSYQTPNQAVGGFEVTTNKPSVGAYRAPLAPQAAFVVETVLDQLALELDLDPVEFRLRNASEKGAPMASGMPWAGMGQRQVLEALRDHPAWKNREQARAEGRGVGIALGAWPGGTEPASAACALQTDGTLKVQISTADINGTNTSMALMAAEAFGLDPDKVTIATGDTSAGTYAGASGGSKTIYTVGPPVIQAAREARRQTLELAAQTFEADPEDLEIVDGAVQVKGSPDKAIPLKKIAQRTMRFGGRQAPVFGHGRHAQTSQAPGFCAQLAEVRVDRETGRGRRRPRRRHPGLRQGDQSGCGRGPDDGRRPAGRRLGALRGDGLQRGRPAPDGDPERLRPARLRAGSRRTRNGPGRGALRPWALRRPRRRRAAGRPHSGRGRQRHRRRLRRAADGVADDSAQGAGSAQRVRVGGDRRYRLETPRRLGVSAQPVPFQELAPWTCCAAFHGPSS